MLYCIILCYIIIYCIILYYYFIALYHITLYFQEAASFHSTGMSALVHFVFRHIIGEILCYAHRSLVTQILTGSVISHRRNIIKI